MRSKLAYLALPLGMMFAVPAIAAGTANEPNAAAAQNGNADARNAQAEKARSVAKACLQSLEKLDRDLRQSGYNYGGYGYGPYGRVGAPGTAARPMGAGAAVSAPPPAQLRSAMQAGYVFAMNGDSRACEAVVAGAKRLRAELPPPGQRPNLANNTADRRQQAFLEGAIPVDQLKSLRAQEIMGADVRNTDDKPLGSVSDILLNKQGQIAYVLVSRGGFLGIGGELVPVPWSLMKVANQPYHSTTLVLNVPQKTMNDVTSVKSDQQAQNNWQQWQSQVNGFWHKNTPRDNAATNERHR